MRQRRRNAAPAADVGQAAAFRTAWPTRAGLVGKYLMFNTAPRSVGVFEHPLNEYKSVRRSRASCTISTISIPKAASTAAAASTRAFDLSPTTWAINAVCRRDPRWGSDLQGAR